MACDIQKQFDNNQSFGDKTRGRWRGDLMGIDGGMDVWIGSGLTKQIVAGGSWIALRYIIIGEGGGRMWV